jgi:hypothetical protein
VLVCFHYNEKDIRIFSYNFNLLQVKVETCVGETYIYSYYWVINYNFGTKSDDCNLLSTNFIITALEYTHVSPMYLVYGDQISANRVVALEGVKRLSV